MTHDPPPPKPSKPTTRAQDGEQPVRAPEPTEIPEAARHDHAERPGTAESAHDHDDALADEWGRESFPSSDPPAHY